MAPIDLQAEFGRRWRIDQDESAGGRLRDPWLATIPCRHGHLFAAGPDSIGAATNRPGAIVRKLRSIPGVELVADGSDGANLIFGRAALPSVARVMKPRSRRQLSPAHAAALARGRKSQKALSGGAIGGAGSPIGGNTARETPAADGPSAVPVFDSRSTEAPRP